MDSKLDLRDITNTDELALKLSEVFGIRLNSKKRNLEGLSLYHEPKKCIVLGKRAYTLKNEREDIMVAHEYKEIQITYLTFSERLARLRFDSLEYSNDPLLRRINEYLKTKERTIQGYTRGLFVQEDYKSIASASTFLEFIVEEFKKPTLIQFNEQLN